MALAQSKNQLLPPQVIVDASRLLREIEKEVRQIRNEFAIQVHGLEGVKVKFVFDTNLGSLAVHADRFADALSAIWRKPGIDKASVIFVSWDGRPPHMLKLMERSAGETTIGEFLEFRGGRPLAWAPIERQKLTSSSLSMFCLKAKRSDREL